MKKILLIAFASASFAQAQNPTQQVDVTNYQPALLQEAIINLLNATRWDAGADSLQSNDMLFDAAGDLAADYAKSKKAAVIPDYAGQVVRKKGGTLNVEEVVSEAMSSKSKVPSTYAEVAKDIVDRLKNSNKYMTIITKPKYFFTGIGSAVNEDNNKIYVSMIFGGVDAMNEGAKDKTQLSVPFSTKKKGLKPFDDKECRACNKFPNIERLTDKLYIDGDNVVLEYDDWKAFQKYFRNTKDGLAVDVIQKGQYPCNSANIFDYNLNSRGYLLKPMYQKKLFKANELLDDNGKAKAYKATIGVIPSEIKDKLGNDYELNLLYIVNKHVCKTLYRYYLEDGGISALQPLSIFPDTAQATDANKYIPKNEDQELTFRIPFEQGKTDYKPEDIKPFLDALNEPKFIINEIDIVAHSSLEGDSAMNAKLQKGRAESIVNALEQYQKQSVKYNITTDDSWQMFKDSLKKTEFSAMANLAKSEVKKTLVGDVLAEYEPILSKERFAEIKMKVTYDISGSNEENFVLSNYKKALDKKDVQQALRIQRYIIPQIENGKYDYQNFIAIEIPKEKDYASLLANKEYVSVKYGAEDSIGAAVMQYFSDLNKTMSANDFVAFNTTMSNVAAGALGTITNQKETQAAITALYNHPKIPQRVNDALNLQWQFKVIAANDTLEPGVQNDAVQKAMDQIKKIYKIEAATQKNALTLSYVFIKHNDFDFARKILEPYLTREDVDEQLLFTYVSASAYNHDNVYTRGFRQAMQKAAEKDPERYCALFGYPKLTFQMMDNPLIKKQYCEQGCH